MMRHKRVRFVWVVTGLVIALMVFAMLPVGQNLWFQLTGWGWFIPRESSIWRFRPLVLNQGSGEWWIIAADPDWYFYAGDGVGDQPYVKLSREAASRCAGFAVLDFDTWCPESREQP